MIITISGMPGSGKSTVAKLLAKRLHMKHYYMGMMRRKMAKERGMTLTEFNKFGESEKWTDKFVDDYQVELSGKEDDFIIEGRTSFFFIPKSLKVFLDVDAGVGARRIFEEMKNERNRRKRNEGNPKNLADMAKSMKERNASDRKRYMKYYNIDFTDKSNYDIIIDTTKLVPSQVVDRILKIIEKNKRGK